LLKDNEKIPFLDDVPLAPSGPQGFSHDQMVRCEACLRANPPTRVTCLYCAAALPASENTVVARTLSLRPIESSALGYNSILLPKPSNEFESEGIEAAANFLKMSLPDLQRITNANLPLPLARTATREEADLVTKRLSDFGVDVFVVSDSELKLEQPPSYVRAAEIGEDCLKLKQSGGGESFQVAWDKIELLVTGRLITKKVESAERKGRRGESEIVEATEFFADELVLDLYTEPQEGSFRVTSNSFDFSCLSQRSVVAAENFPALVSLLRSNATKADYDDLYPSVRQALDPIWTFAQHTGSRGWRRERPGKYNIEAVTESSNENQFTRYSRLRRYLRQRPQLNSQNS
jgi:hypothetical protein